jgi:hypothetical protein
MNWSPGLPRFFKGAGAGGMEDEYAEEEKEDCGIPVL